MENQTKCSLKKHAGINAISYCQECDKYMCNKCQSHHDEIMEDHHKYNLKDLGNIFTGICKEPNHKNELEFFCEDHNQLCCSSCISKIKDKGYGQHSECKVCTIEKIKGDKKEVLAQNIKILEKYLKEIENSLNELKKIIDKVNANKQELKLKISKIFTQIRNIINQREDELLLKVDNIFKNRYVDDDFINKNKNLSNKIKKSLEKGKLINNEWDNSNIKLNSIINDSLNIENIINNINEINKTIEKYKSNDEEIIFIPDNEKDINNQLEIIKKFGELVPKDELLSIDGLEKDAIEMVMNEGKCSRQAAIQALRAHNGDPVEALLDVGN